MCTPVIQQFPFQVYLVLKPWSISEPNRNPVKTDCWDPNLEVLMYYIQGRTHEYELVTTPLLVQELHFEDCCYIENVYPFCVAPSSPCQKTHSHAYTCISRYYL